MKGPWPAAVALAAALLASGCVIPDFSPAEAVSGENLKARALEGVRSVRSLNFSSETTATLTPLSVSGTGSGSMPSTLRSSTSIQGTLDNRTGAMFLQAKSEGSQGAQETAGAVVGGFNYTRDPSGAWLKERVTPEEGKRQVSEADPMKHTAQLFAISNLTWDRWEGGLYVVKVAPDRAKLLELVSSGGPSFLSQSTLETVQATYRLEPGTFYPADGELRMRFRVTGQSSASGYALEMNMSGRYAEHNRVPPAVLPKEALEAPTPDECAAKECFVAAANACKRASITAAESYGTLRYSSKECTLTKTVLSPSPSEKPQLKALLEGASMTCAYERGKFDRTWLDSLLAGVEQCEGRLKELIADLLVFA